MDWTQTLTIIVSLSTIIGGSLTWMTIQQNRMDDRHREDIKNIRKDMKSMDEKWSTAIQKMDEKWSTAIQKMDEKWERLFEKFFERQQK